MYQHVSIHLRSFAGHLKIKRSGISSKTHLSWFLPHLYIWLSKKPIPIRVKNKVCISDKPHKRQLLTQNLGMVYHHTNLSKLVWFGIIWLVFAKYHLWGIFPTQFLPKNTNFVSESKNIGIYGFWILPCCLTCKKRSEFQKFIFSIIF